MQILVSFMGSSRVENVFFIASKLTKVERVDSQSLESQFASSLAIFGRRVNLKSLASSHIAKLGSKEYLVTFAGLFEPLCQ